MLSDVIDRRQPILVVGDYDCDGATAIAVAVLGLRTMGATVDYLVPNRFENGYGLTPEVADLAARHPRLGCPALLLTVDNGIASVTGVERAHALGMKVLVTDHHLPGKELPAAEVIVNPNQVGCAFPSKCIAGVGVVFYVLTALRALRRRAGAVRRRAAAARAPAGPGGAGYRGRRGAARPEQPDPRRRRACSACAPVVAGPAFRPCCRWRDARPAP